jgi:TonB family protein
MQQMNRRLAVLGLLLSTVLLSSASFQSVAIGEEPIEVTREERAAYWQPVNPRTRRFAGAIPIEEYQKLPSGYVDVEFIIDSDGVVQDIRILASSPPGVWDDHARIDIAGFRYEPTPANSARRPVKVSQRFTYQPR